MQLPGRWTPCSTGGRREISWMSTRFWRAAGTRRNSYWLSHASTILASRRRCSPSHSPAAPEPAHLHGAPGCARSRTSLSPGPELRTPRHHGTSERSTSRVSGSAGMARARRPASAPESGRPPAMPGSHTGAAALAAGCVSHWARSRGRSRPVRRLRSSPGHVGAPCYLRQPQGNRRTSPDQRPRCL